MQQGKDEYKMAMIQANMAIVHGEQWRLRRMEGQPGQEQQLQGQAAGNLMSVCLSPPCLEGPMQASARTVCAYLGTH